MKIFLTLFVAFVIFFASSVSTTSFLAKSKSNSDVEISLKSDDSSYDNLVRPRNRPKGPKGPKGPKNKNCDKEGRPCTTSNDCCPNTELCQEGKCYH